MAVLLHAFVIDHALPVQAEGEVKHHLHVVAVGGLSGLADGPGCLFGIEIGILEQSHAEDVINSRRADSSKRSRAASSPKSRTHI